MLNVICLKHGTKYGPEYVNKLYNMVRRHLHVPYRFVCFTDDTTDINPDIEIRMLPTAAIAGWWWKPYVFKADHFPVGDTNLFLDLDTVIVKNFTQLTEYLPGKFLGLRDVGRVFRQSYQKLGSAVMRWPAGQYSDIWTDMERNHGIMRKFHGDQDWIWHLHKNNITFYPDPWIRSYKWEIRSKEEILGVGPRARFISTRNPAIPVDCCILAFHGHPRVDQVLDQVIVDNWQ
jgi:hypothetical protein